MSNRRIMILCECCALKLTNDDESGCRDYHHHTHPSLQVAGHLVLQNQQPYIWDGHYTPDCHGHGGQITTEKFWVAEVVEEPGSAEPTWPETEEERALFKDWQYEVSNGDTLRGFRDWLDARDELEVADLIAEAEEPDDDLVDSSQQVRAEKAEADLARVAEERDRLTHLLGSHADGHRCTCEMTDPGKPGIEPPTWEQDPWCLTHPDMDMIVAEVKTLKSKADRYEALREDVETHDADEQAES